VAGELALALIKVVRLTDLVRLIQIRLYLEYKERR
jgi:hypothetical protein